MIFKTSRILIPKLTLLIGMVLFFSSCGVYKQNIMFKTDNTIIPENVQAATFEAEKNYKIKKNDFLNIQVFTNGGERIIDPDFELLKQTGIQANQQLNRPNPNFLVQQNGLVRLPMVGAVALEGLTLREAELLLQEKYSEFYESPYVLANYINKRVIVLGANEGSVVPLANENTTLMEVLALAGGLGRDFKARNIRLIRGPLDNPEVYVIDLSTIEGMSKSIVKVFPGDIVYVEPVRRPFAESIRDLAPIVTLVTSGVALFISIRSLTRD